MSNRPFWAVALENSIALVCFTVLAVVFKHWWIVLFYALFITSYKNKHD